MELINNIIVKNDMLNYNIFGSNEELILSNVSEHREGNYKFKNPQPGSTNDIFIIIYSGNKKIAFNKEEYNVAHYLLIKQNEDANYLISTEVFDKIFIKII